MEQALLPAVINFDPLWEDTGFALALMGLFVVFAALILVRIFIGSLPKIMAILDRISPESKETAAEATPAVKEEIPEAIIAVIAAVVADTVGVRHRIVRTRELASSNKNWSLEGRIQHHASHRLKPRDPR